jgi:hypothetical protein
VATTGAIEPFVAVAERLFGDRLPRVESVSVESAAAGIGAVGQEVESAASSPRPGLP